MIHIKGNTYRICLFDTNALSELLKSTKRWITYFDSKFSLSTSTITYSAFTLSELWYREELFDRYIETFSSFPSLMLDGHESLLQKEVGKVVEGKDFTPVALAPFAIREDSLSPKERLKFVIENSGFIDRTTYWKNGQNEILEGMLDIKRNFPPKGKTYNKAEINEFVELASHSQLAMRVPDFYRKCTNEGNAIDMNQFPSLRSMAYFVFYKFYVDQRTPTNSDVVDLIISSLLPYVDMFITEGNNCEIAQKIQKRHSFLESLEVYSIRDIKKEISNDE